MDHLIQAQSEAEESSDPLDYELLYSQAFFMGLLAGVVLAKSTQDAPAKVANSAKKFVKQVPSVLKSASNHSKINDLLGQLLFELDSQGRSQSTSVGMSELGESFIVPSQSFLACQDLKFEVNPNFKELIDLTGTDSRNSDQV